MKKKKNIGELNQTIYFLENVENTSAKDALGGYSTTWIPALGELSDFAEAGTTTTNIKMTTHGLSDGDYILNATRSGSIRLVTKVDANNITVASITGQTTSDIIRKRLFSLSNVWGSIRTKNNYYQMESQQKTDRVTHEVEIRYRSDISPKFRIRCEGRYFEIISFYDLDGSEDRLIIECRELI